MRSEFKLLVLYVGQGLGGFAQFNITIITAIITVKYLLPSIFHRSVELSR